MTKMLVPYDPFGESAVRRLVAEAMASHCRFYASDVAPSLGYDRDDTFDELLRTAIRAGAAMHITLSHHFVPLYRHGDDGLFADWKLSRLACTLIIMQADPRHPEVTDAQLQLLRRIAKL
jgi:DNA-damage-inducible protein D